MDLRVEIPVHIKRDRRARKVITPGDAPQVQESVPRIARLLALAHKWEGMVRRGEVKDYAEIARRYRISRARVTQICSLALLPPTVQECILVKGTRFRNADLKYGASNQRDPTWNPGVDS